MIKNNNKIKQLIKTLCPDRMEFLELSKVADILNGYSFKSSKYCKKGIRVVRISDVQKGKMSDKDLKYYPVETEKEISRFLLKENDLVMSLTGNVGRVAMLSKSDLPAGLNQRVACIRVRGNKVLTRYLFHLFDQDSFETEATSNATGGGQKNMSTTWLGKFKIPIPPLPIQEEIVKILNSFTELEAELEARKKQYEYYNRKLFENTPLKNWIEIRELVSDNFWIMPSTPKFELNERIPYITSKNIRSRGIDFSNVKYISSSSYEDLSKKRSIECDDLLIGMIGTIGEIARIKDTDPKFYGQNMYLLRLNQNMVNIEYFLHFFDSPHVKSLLFSNRKQSSQGYLKAEDILSTKIPLPDMSEQQAIALKLDRFYIINNDISIGLPAELNARRKQYEYYRNKLLTFKELK